MTISKTRRLATSFYGYIGSAVAITSPIALLTTSAQAQISSPMASYSGEMSIAPSEGDILTTKIFAVPHSRRSEIATENGVMVSIINTQTQEAYTYGKDANGPMGVQAMKINYGTVAKSMAADMSQLPDPILKGTDIVAGQVCNDYTTTEGTACVTRDGILLRALSSDGSKIEMTSLTRGAQPDYLFRVPNGYVISDMSEMTAMGVENEAGESPSFQSFIENQAHKQTKKQVKKMARKQIGNTVGGAIGGSLVGGTVGNEAGKLAKGLVGGLFGKKKKKKKELEEKQDVDPNDETGEK